MMTLTQWGLLVDAFGVAILWLEYATRPNLESFASLPPLPDPDFKPSVWNRWLAWRQTFSRSTANVLANLGPALLLAGFVMQFFDQ
ncbi:MAG: hypothetical protein AAFN63_01605 [Pseudomonadota bacterium]